MQFTCKTCGWSGSVSARPRCLACYAARTKRWRSQNPELAREQRRKWEAKFRRERPEEYNRKRRIKRSREAMRAAYIARRDWLAAGTVTSDDLRAIAERDGRACVYCKAAITRFGYSPKSPRGFDHVQARANGGKHEPSNLVACCAACNAAKRDW